MSVTAAVTAVSAKADKPIPFMEPSLSDSSTGLGAPPRGAPLARPSQALRTALVLLRPGVAAAAAPRDAAATSAPRGYLFEDMFDVAWDLRLLDGKPWSPLPAWFRLALEVHRRRADYDLVLTWGERLTFSLLALQWMLGTGPPHVAIITQFGKPNIAGPMRLLGHGLRAVLTFTSVQRAYAIRQGHVAADRLFLIRHFVDQRFFHPRPGAGDLVCAVGAEMRDYPTLFAALDGTAIRCHVAAGEVRVPGRLRLIKDRRVQVADLATRPNPHVTIGRKTVTELRDLYAQSRFVVVPLLPSQSDNGVTVILEAMAMGKAVICTRTAGQVDVIQDGVTGILVPAGDPQALRAAMQALWNDPERAAVMGARGRAYVERHHTLEGFCVNVRQAIAAAMAGTPAGHGWWEADPAQPASSPDAPAR